MKIIYQGNHRTKTGEGTTTKKDEAALSEGSEHFENSKGRQPVCQQESNAEKDQKGY